MFAVVSPAPRTVTRGPQAGREQSLSEDPEAAAVPASDACLRRRLLRSARSSSVRPFRVPVVTSRAAQGSSLAVVLSAPSHSPGFKPWLCPSLPL